MGAVITDHHIDEGLGALLILRVQIVTVANSLYVHINGRIDIGGGGEIVGLCHTAGQIVHVGSGHVALDHTKFKGHAAGQRGFGVDRIHRGLGIHRGIGIHGLIGRRHVTAAQIHVPTVQVLL